MGGNGSGHYYRWNKKTTVEECQSLDLKSFKKLGLLDHPYKAGVYQWLEEGEVSSSIEYWLNLDAERLELRYRCEEQFYHYSIRLASMALNFGGKRYWMHCPYCQRKNRVLYLGGGMFLCRKCQDLAYSSQQESPMFRHFSQAQKINKRLGGDGYFDYGYVPRPKGMHQKTYQRLHDKMMIRHDLCWSEAGDLILEGQEKLLLQAFL